MYVEKLNGFQFSGIVYVLLARMVTMWYFCFSFCRNLTFLPQLPRQYYTLGVCALKIWEHLICHNFSTKNNARFQCVIFLFTNLRSITIRICQLNLLMVVFKTFLNQCLMMNQTFSRIFFRFSNSNSCVAVDNISTLTLPTFYSCYPLP